MLVPEYWRISSPPMLAGPHPPCTQSRFHTLTLFHQNWVASPVSLSPEHPLGSLGFDFETRSDHSYLKTQFKLIIN